MKYIISTIIILFLALLGVSIINVAYQAACFLWPWGDVALLVFAVIVVLYRRYKSVKIAKRLKEIYYEHTKNLNEIKEKMKEAVKDDTTIN